MERVAEGARHAWDPPSTGWRSTRVRLRDFSCQTKGPAPLWGRRPEWKTCRLAHSIARHNLAITTIFLLSEIDQRYPQGYSSHLPHRLLPFCEKPSLSFHSCPMQQFVCFKMIKTRLNIVIQNMSFWYPPRALYWRFQFRRYFWNLDGFWNACNV
jgi:hypothetical protein